MLDFHAPVHYVGNLAPVEDLLRLVALQAELRPEDEWPAVPLLHLHSLAGDLRQVLTPPEHLDDLDLFFARSAGRWCRIVIILSLQTDEFGDTLKLKDEDRSAGCTRARLRLWIESRDVALRERSLRM